MDFNNLSSISIPTWNNVVIEHENKTANQSSHEKQKVLNITKLFTHTL
jgi:hypothetical protein